MGYQPTTNCCCWLVAVVAATAAVRYLWGGGARGCSLTADAFDLCWDVGWSVGGGGAAAIV